MIFVADREQFAAQRRGALVRGDERIGPVVTAALADWPSDHWWDAIVEAAGRLFDVTAEAEGVRDPATVAGARDQFTEAIGERLRETTDPGGQDRATQVTRLTNWVSTASINAATAAAAEADDGSVNIEWITMHDAGVRATHDEADGQDIPAGATFTVAGYELHYPGEPVGPPAVWINCRCVVRPGPGGNMTAAAGTDVADDLDPEAPEITDDDLDMDVPFYGVAAPEGVPTGDRRKFALSSLRVRDLPVPMRFMYVDDEGHKGSVPIGRIDRVWREDDLMKYEGVFHRSDDAEKAIDLVANRVMRGVSVDLDDTTVEMQNEDGSAFDPETWALGDPEPLAVVTDGRIASATICSIPAFQEAFISIGTWADHPTEEALAACLPCQAAEALDEEYTTLETLAIAEGSWDGSASRFTPEEWRRSCILDTGEGDTDAKSRYRLPILEPNGDLSRAGVHAAAGRFGQVDASASAKQKARGRLIAAYRRLDEEPPETLAYIPDEQFAEAEIIEFAPGTHDGPGWITHPRATARIRRYWVHGKGAAKIRWGTPGDFNRCRTQLAKYVKNPKWLAGLCANMHKEAIKVWPGQETGRKHSLEGTPAEAFTLVESVVAGGELPPKAWFVNPEFTGPHPVTVDEDGRVYGHLALWSTCHIGVNKVCTSAPTSDANYAYFTTGAVLTDEGQVPVGNITMDTGHAAMNLRARPAMAHYDNTGAVAADVAAGEDAWGIWVAGAVRPGLPEDKVYALRAATLSGDWRQIGSNLELVAALAVNVPGFPIPRTALAASGGEQTALVASGIVLEHEATEAIEEEVVAPTPSDAVLSLLRRARRDAAAAVLFQ